MSFRNRLFLVIAGVVLAIEAITMFAALQALERDAVANSSRDLRVGERVFRELFETRERQLATGVRVLADDFGFKEAVATGDPGTLASALANHGKRIHADLVAFITAKHEIAASTHRFSSQTGKDAFPFDDLLADNAPNGTLARTVVLPEGPFQMVVAPVRAPQLIGWVSVGFAVDDMLAATLKDLTGLEVSFLTTRQARALHVPASTLSAEDRVVLSSNYYGGLPPELAAAPTVVNLAATDYLSYALDLEGHGSVTALLQRSMRDALSGYRRLLDQLVVIFASTLLIALAAARFVAGGVTQPLGRLAAAAGRIAGGSYDQPVEVARKDELGVLANAFNEMQQGISRREQRILHQSRHDTLTDLPNRTALNEHLAAAVARAERHGRHGAVLVIDLRAFKAINDTFGHETGDVALRALAARFLALARASDTVARYGGNCFVMLADDISENDLRSLAQRVLETVKDPLPLHDAQVRIDLTIGISFFPEHGTDADSLLRRAEIAMYTARQQNEALAYYHAGQDENHLRKLEIMKELAIALEKGHLDVVYQPKMVLRTGRIEQAEALVRWKHQQLGFISPAEFVPIAEQSGLMRQLTTTVLHKVANQVRRWTDRDIDLIVSVNISTIDLIDMTFPERLAAIVAEHGVSPDRFQLEITESALMQDPENAGAVMERLRKNGYRLSIDDFGTGYSSLAQLKHMPVSELKIDKSFVLGLPNNLDDAVIVRSTIELGHNLGLSVVAEGTEHDACIAFLRDAGCDLAQGYGISRPLAADDFITWLEKRHGAIAPDRDTSGLNPGGQLALQT
jgi:diguanylate cyclase (GGDEF)-like protein